LLQAISGITNFGLYGLLIIGLTSHVGNDIRSEYDGAEIIKPEVSSVIGKISKAKYRLAQIPQFMYRKNKNPFQKKMDREAHVGLNEYGLTVV
jgi:hypothetical protein